MTVYQEINYILKKGKEMRKKRMVWKRIVAVALAVVMVVCANSTAVQAGSEGRGLRSAYNGLIPDANGTWQYHTNGTPDFGYTGLASNEYGWWYVQNGVINFNYSGLVPYGDTWWCVANGRVAFEYTGLWYDANVGWWYVENGAINFNYSGLVLYGDVWWCVAGGRLAFEYTGLWYDANVGWWYVENGAINFNYSGLVLYGDTWWCVAGGRLAFEYTGLWYDANVGWWYVENGAINFNYSGLVPYGDAWWCVANGRVAFEYTGLWYDANVGWWCVVGGAIAFGYTGLFEDANLGWWYIRNGAIAFDYTGEVKNEYGTWYVENGKLSDDSSSNGMILIDGVWKYKIDGVVADWYTGLGQNEYGTWYYENGTINYGFTGTFKVDEKDDDSWVYVRRGQVIPDYTGLAQNAWGDWYFKNGKMVQHYTGTASDDNGVWFYMKNGQIDSNFAGMAPNGDEWLYFVNGKASTTYEGIARNPEGTWYLRNGRIAKDFSGTYQDGNVTYTVSNGAAKVVVPTNPKELLLGVFFNSREDTTDTLYVSFDGYDFRSIGEAFTNAFPEIEEDNRATVSPSLNPNSAFSSWVVNTMHDPSIFYKDGRFWMCGGYSENGLFYPMLSYSTDLKTWSFPSTGKSSATNQLNQGLKPATIPYDANGNRVNENDYDAVAVDFIIDDDGSVWFIVALGVYADSHENKLSHYIVKATGLNTAWTSADLQTEQQKVEYSDFTVDYGQLVEINLPQGREVYNSPEGYEYFYDYDGSLFKMNGKYYLATMYSGEWIQFYSIDDLNRASDPNAWTLVNPEVLEGSEGPYVTEYNNRKMMYTDRYDYWDFHDIWTYNEVVGPPAQYGIFASVLPGLDKPLADSVRITTTDWNGKKIPARHGTVIRLTDPTAIKAAMDLYNAYYK